VDLYAAGVARGQWEVRVNGEKAGLTRLDTILDGKVEVAGVSAMVLTKGVAACQHSFKGGVCTHCGARQPKSQKKNFLSRFMKKNR
jgi:hypothetical protein